MGARCGRASNSVLRSRLNGGVSSVSDFQRVMIWREWQTFEEVIGPVFNEVPRVERDDVQVVDGIGGFLDGSSDVIVLVANATVVFDIEVEFGKVEVWAERSCLAIVVDGDLLLVDERNAVVVERARYVPFAP